MNEVNQDKEYAQVEEALQQQLHLTTIVGSVKFLLFLAATFAFFQMAMYTLDQCTLFIARMFGV